MANEPFRIVVGAERGVSTENLKKDIGNILRKLPRESRSIVVRINTAETQKALQGDLNRLVKNLQLSMQGLKITGTDIATPASSAGKQLEKQARGAKTLESALKPIERKMAEISRAEGKLLTFDKADERASVMRKRIRSLREELDSMLQSSMKLNQQLFSSNGLYSIDDVERRASQASTAQRAEENYRMSSYSTHRSNYTQWWKDALAERDRMEAAAAAERQATETRSRNSYIQWWKLALDQREQEELAAAENRNAIEKRNRDAYVHWWSTAIAERDRMEAAAAAERANLERRNRDSYINWWSSELDARDNEEQKIKDELALAEKRNTALEKYESILARIRKLRTTSLRADAVSRLKSLRLGFNSDTASQEDIDKFVAQLHTIEVSLRNNNALTETATERFARLFNTKLGYAFITGVLTTMTRLLRQIYQNVVEIDTAMTELRKVTDETEATYTRFLENAADRATKLGAALSDVVSATADFARLGYSISEATQLADAALVYKNVGDGINDINEASESVISTMQAFSVEADKAMTIVDKFNIIGNTEAISSGGVGQAMMNSAAALHAANNTIEESIALIAAANTTAQDPSKVGTTMKTLSMFLRAAKTEAEEAGESTEGMAESVSKLREEILALTGNEVDIMLDDSTFKSTFAIMQELSRVWDRLTDVSRANILERIAGKRNANIAAALLENFEVAERALVTAQNSAGSALAENEKYLDSIRGKLDQLAASWQALSTNILNNEAVKGIIDLLRGLLDFLNRADDLTDGWSTTILTATAALIGLHTAIWTLSNGTWSLFGHIKALAISFVDFSKAASAGTLAANALSLSMKKFMLAAGAVGMIIIALGELYQVYKENNPSVEEMESSLSDLEVELGNLQGELQATSDRIKELQELADNGTISLVEQDELERLKQQNDLLLAQKKLKEDERNRIGAQLAQANLDVVNGKAADYRGQDVYDAGGNIYQAGISRFDALYQDIDKYKSLMDEYQKALDNGDTKLADKLKKQADDLASSMGAQMQVFLDASETFDPTRSEEEAKAIADIVKAYDAYRLATGDAAVAQEVWNDILQRTQYADVIQKLQDLADAGELTGEKIKELYDADPEGGQLNAFIDMLKGLGLIKEIDAEHLGLIVNQLKKVEPEIKKATVAVGNLTTELKTAEEALDGVAGAYKTVAEGGHLTIEQVDSLLSDYPDLIQFIKVENGQLTISKNILLEKMEAYKLNRIEALKTSRETIKGLKQEAEALKLTIDLEQKRFIARRVQAGDSYGDAYRSWNTNMSWNYNLDKMISEYDEQIKTIDQQIAIWENINIPQLLVGEITTPETDYAAQYKPLLDMFEEVEHKAERLDRMSEDMSKEQLQMWSNLRDKILEAMAGVRKGTEEYRYLEEQLWKVNDAMEAIYDQQIDSINNIIDMTKEMIKEEYEDQIDAIEEQTDAYQELIDKKKEALQVDKDAADYNKQVSEKVKEIAKLQSNIAKLSLDDSREAAAKKASLEEELAAAQKELAELQSDHALETTGKLLDDEADAYEKAQDDRIDSIEDMLDDEVQLYKDAINRIGNMEDAFYNQLENWARAHGEDIKKLAEDWEIAKNAKQGYADLDAALTGIGNASGALGSLDKDGSYNFSSAQAILSKMAANSAIAKKNGTSWVSTGQNGEGYSLHEENKKLAAQYQTITGQALHYDPKKGWCYADGTPAYKFHSGGIVGGGSLRDDELMAILQRGELVLADGHKENLSKLIEGVKSTISMMVSGNILSSMKKMSAPADASNMTFAPHLETHIHHNGTMTDADATHYGDIVSQKALEQLRVAFNKRGY